METVTNTAHIRGDIGSIFDLVTTASYWTQWHPATVGVSGQIEQPVLRGDRIRERAMIGDAIAENVWTVTEWERNKRVVLEMPNTRLGDLKITYTFQTTYDGIIFTRELIFDTNRLSNEMAHAVQKQMTEDSQVAVERLKVLVQVTGAYKLKKEKNNE